MSFSVFHITKQFLNERSERGKVLVAKESGLKSDEKDLRSLYATGRKKEDDAIITRTLEYTQRFFRYFFF